MSVLAFATKTLREQWRRPKQLAITLGLPVAFMLVFGFVFSQGQDDPFRIAVLDEDAGPAGAAFIGALDASDAVETTMADRSAGIAQVQDRAVDLFVVVPPDFSSSLACASCESTVLEIHGDPSAQRFGPAVALVEAYASSFAEEATGRPAPIATAVTTVASDELRPFAFIAPGLMVFAILNLAPQGAAVLARESERGTLDRVRMGRTGAAPFLLGTSLAGLVVAAVAMALMLAAAMAMGFRPQGGVPLAYLVVLIAAISIAGFALAVAAFAKDQDESASIGVLFAVPASFLSGAFFAMPDAPLFQVAGHTIEVYHLLPTAFAVDAMRQVMTFGAGLSDVAFELGALAVLSVLWFAIGLALYRWRRFGAVA